MPQETEIKLRIHPDDCTVLRAHSLLEARRVSEWRQHHLANQYFDTPNQDLSAQHVALRIRTDGDQIIQTLKSRGQSIAGLSERQEWDWYLDAATLDAALLDDSCWPQALADLDKSSLAPLFTTDFVRDKVDLAWTSPEGPVAIELALDRGMVSSSVGNEVICELELELRTGTPQALLTLALTLAQEFALMPCDISKAERGYRLLNPESFTYKQNAPLLVAQQSLESAFCQLAWHFLGNSQRLAEQFRFNGHWRLLEEWCAHLVALRALCTSLGQVIPRNSSRVIRAPLDALLADWQPWVYQAQADHSARTQALTRFQEELSATRWGVWSLRSSLWLLQEEWQDTRRATGARQGAMPVLHWLEQGLAKEAQALQLSRYLSDAVALPEQLQRLERILVWLQYARDCLKIVDIDRLYGELLKLKHLLQQPKSSECLAQRRAQVHTLLKLTAWKDWLR